VKDTVRLTVRRIIAAPPERLFDAWTMPEHLTRWWGPSGVTCPGAEVDLRVGGPYRIANRFANGEIVYIVGEFQTIERPHKLVYTWRMESSEGTPEIVTVHFEPRGLQTEVSIIHERIADRSALEGREAGWHGCLDELVAYLAGSGRGLTLKR
jgi:uncharacterized protein YndB with AHSA1/START domain